MKQIQVKYIFLVFMTYWIPTKTILSLEVTNLLKPDTAKTECVKNLIAAIDKLNKEETTRILEEGCDVNWPVTSAHYEYFCPMTCAVSKCDSSLISILLAHGADPNINLGHYYTPIQYAITNCSLSIVKLLLGYMRDVNFLFPDPVHGYQNSPLNFAIISKRADVAKYLIENGASINQDSNPAYETSLSLAMRSRLIDIMKELLDHGADINAKFSEGYEDCLPCPEQITVLHEVTKMLRYEDEQYINRVVDLLLSYKPDLNAVNEEGFTPLGFACFKKNTQLVDKLIKNGASPYSGNYPALNCAAFFSNYEMTKHLLGLKVNPNQQDWEGNTPLLANIYCCGDGFGDGITEENRVKTLTALINAGADPSIKNFRGESFMHVLKRVNLPQIEKLLNKKGLLK